MVAVTGQIEDEIWLKFQIDGNCQEKVKNFCGVNYCVHDR